MAESERVKRTRARWIAVALLGAVFIAGILIAVIWLWRPTPATVTPGTGRPADAAAPARPDQGVDAAAAKEAPPSKKPRPAGTRRLSDRELREAQRRTAPLLRTCAKRQRLEAGQTRKVTVLLQVADGGRIKKATVDAGDDADLAACVRRMVRTWRLPSDLKEQEIVFPVLLGGED